MGKVLLDVCGGGRQRRRSRHQPREPLGRENALQRAQEGSGFPGRPSPADMTECSALTPALLSCRHRILGVADS